MRRAFIVLAALILAAPAFAGSATLTRARDGHFWADARINGRTVRVLVDTGATLVSLTREDARRVGVNDRMLRYDYDVETASGAAKAALIHLDEVAVDRARARDVDALVIQSGLPASILGMSYLKRLTRMDVRGDSMRLED
ncbi:MAG TPA: TIGR02281 family clan AA aspartic protease [Caulobacterales bacterium]|jgi:aspartyl protease family protein|nr:TIGR02281 family clan AA aspartic protease [Caulobacterales bacterium]